MNGAPECLEKEICEKINHQRPPWIYVLATFLILFGLLTIKEGGSVLFFDSTAKVDAGNYVPGTKYILNS